MANTPEAIGQQHAVDVEKKLLHDDVKGAENAFRQHYLDAMNSKNPDDKKAAEAERAALQKLDPSGYKLVMLELAKDTGVLTDSSQKPGEIKSDALAARLPDATAEDKLKGMVANEVLNNYDQLTGGFRHDVSNIFSPGASKTDADRMEYGLKDDLHKRQMAMASLQTFLADDGKVFDKIAGISGHFNRDALEQAIKQDADQKAHHKPGLFTDDQLKQVKWMDDNWYDPAVRQLREGCSTMFEPSNRASASVGGAVAGWRHALGANFHGLWRPLNGVAGAVDAAGEGLWGLVTGDKIASYVNKDAMEKAVKTQFGSDENARTVAGGGTSGQRTEQVNNPAAPPPEKPVPAPTPEKPVPAPTPEKPVPHPTPEKPVPHPAPEKPVPHPAPEKTKGADQDPDVIRNGEGYTYVAVRLLGLVPRNANSQDVEKAFQKLSKQDRADVLALSQALQEANKKRHHGVLYSGERVITDDDKVQAILNPEPTD